MSGLIENQYLAKALLQEDVRELMVRVNLCEPNVCLHSIYTTIYAIAIAQELNYDSKMVHKITQGGLLHDVGKISVPHIILKKPGPLTEREYDIMKEHPLYGKMRCEKLGFPEEVVKIVELHHEKLNGSGYPYGKKDIPEYVQIVTVADMFDALTSDRVYKQTYSPEEAMDVLYQDAEAGRISKKIVDKLWVRELLRIKEVV